MEEALRDGIRPAACTDGAQDLIHGSCHVMLMLCARFTEGQAKDRILAHGDADVSHLKKDDEGI